MHANDAHDSHVFCRKTEARDMLLETATTNRGHTNAAGNQQPPTDPGREVLGNMRGDSQALEACTAPCLTPRVGQCRAETTGGNSTVI